MKDEPVVYAHTPNAEGEWHRLDVHLRRVAELAARFAEPFEQGMAARLLGLFHDVGKWNPAFQKYLQAEAQDKRVESVPHAIWGAALTYEKIKGRWEILSLPILGHHAGLSDRGEAELRLHQFLEKHRDRLKAAFEWLRERGLLEGMAGPLKIPSWPDASYREMGIRMLFSALVDADWLDTEAHFYPDRQTLREQEWRLEAMWERFEESQKEILAKADDSPVNRVRREIYEACLKAADGPPGIYRLTAPTGGGKTRSALAFALRHGLTHGLRRVVVAIPYTSIIDQTAGEYREIFGEDAVLEHHSALDLPGDEEERSDRSILRHRLATENWDAPLIVTTTVQLFESLFSNRPSKVRKLHRLARSVIVLDEVQTLPPELLRPTVEVLKILATPVEEGGYGATVVLSTATQPALEESRWIQALKDVSITEIVPQYPDHFGRLKRVSFEYRREPLAWEELAQEIREQRQVLVVLNTRRDAAQLVRHMEEGEDVYHLSTLLCPAHRRKVLEEVRRRLEGGEPVRLISTQVVEAGVDLDFPVVYRALGPLDRVVQAAGRCNRNGKLPGAGRVVIFRPKDGRLPGGPYRQGTEKAALLLDLWDSPERLHDPEAYREYFRRLYDDLALDLDREKVEDYRRELNYPEVAARYRLIPDDTVPVVVPYGDAEKRLKEWLDRGDYESWKQLQLFAVGLFRWEVRKSPYVAPVSEGLYRWLGEYDDTLGITREMEDPADLIV